MALGWWTRFKQRISKPQPPVIHTQWGPVDERARHQAALNMRDNPATRQRIEEMIGVEESRRRYPESYPNE